MNSVDPGGPRVRCGLRGTESGDARWLPARGGDRCRSPRPAGASLRERRCGRAAWRRRPRSPTRRRPARGVGGRCRRRGDGGSGSRVVAATATARASRLSTPGSSARSWRAEDLLEVREVVLRRAAVPILEEVRETRDRSAVVERAFSVRHDQQQRAGGLRHTAATSRGRPADSRRARVRGRPARTRRHRRDWCEIERLTEVEPSLGTVRRPDVHVYVVGRLLVATRPPDGLRPEVRTVERTEHRVDGQAPLRREDPRGAAHLQPPSSTTRRDARGARGESADGGSGGGGGHGQGDGLRCGDSPSVAPGFARAPPGFLARGREPLR